MKYEKAGKLIQCQHCGSNEFQESGAQLNTAGMTLIGLDWLNHTAETYHCEKCGRIEWFAQIPNPKPVLKQETGPKCDCCGRILKKGSKDCHKCGWVSK